MEAGGQLSQKWPKLVCFPTNISELGFESRFALEVLHLKPLRGILHIDGKELRKNLKCGFVRLEVCKSVIEFLP